MERPRIVDGGDRFQMWRVNINILDKQRGQPMVTTLSVWGSGEGRTTPPYKNRLVTKYYTGFGLGWFLWNYLSNGNGHDIWNTEC